MTLNAALIVSLVRAEVSEVTEAKWEQPFADTGYFTGTKSGRGFSVVVVMRSSTMFPIVWNEARVALEVVHELRRAK